MFKESKTRSTKKTISWRLIAFSNSWLILSLSITELPFWNAVIMNVTGMIMFYLHERFWNKVNEGKYYG